MRPGRGPAGTAATVTPAASAAGAATADATRPPDERLPGGLQLRQTTRADGDMSGGDPGAEARRRGVLDRPWTLLRQVHGSRVLRVSTPGEGTGEPADAAVTTEAGVALAVLTADCVPVAFSSPEGVIGVAHAGWRGLRDGVIEATVSFMRRLGAGPVTAVVGPCIHPECYAFSIEDLDDLAAVLGPSVRGRDRHGAPALDLPSAVRRALERADADLAQESPACTACSPSLWSWRGGRDRSRQATVAWR